MIAIKWLDKISFLKLLGIYLLTLIGVFAISVAVFFFPILPFCELTHKEFSNLGPIVTGLCGIFIDVYVVTPIFIFIFIAKLIKKLTHSFQKKNAI